MEPIVKLETEIYRISRRRSRSLDNARYCFAKNAKKLQRFITHVRDCSTQETFCLVTIPLYSRRVFVKLPNVNVFYFTRL